MLNNSRPKIGVALSGAAGRAIAHIGVLEVLKENNIPIDYLVGCSSGALIAASYATDTMEELKAALHKLDVSTMLSFWSTKNAKGGLFQMHKGDSLFEQFTKGLTFEQIDHPKLGFVTTDINTGELVNLTSGDMKVAFKAAVAVPGLFEPVIINNRILVDGGLVNIVPTKAVEEMGADIVLGVNIAATPFIYDDWMWRGYKWLARFLGLKFFRNFIWNKFSTRIFFKLDLQSDTLKAEDIKIPGVFAMLTKALDHTLVITEQWTESDMACDLMLEPQVKHFGKTQFDSLDKIYLEGRKTAERALPRIRELIREKQAARLTLVAQES